MVAEEPQNKRIAIFGSTGSIGKQALDVVRAHPGEFDVMILVALSNWKLLVEQAREFRPRAVVIGNEQLFDKVSVLLEDTGVQVYAGEDSVSQIARATDVDLILLALVGAAGLKPAFSAIDQGTDIALANKESLVVGGDLLMQHARRKGSAVLPVDSEHSAIFQCLSGERHKDIEKVILTASGGPFRGYSREELTKVTPEQALNHPNWDMGCKITIDSASLMNKGLELIEAKWLFGLRADQLDVIIHPQSVIHSMVQFGDGSIKAQMGLPDMKIPIMYALSWPGRLNSSFERFTFDRYPELTFEKPDMQKFRNLALAFEALRREGNLACVMNAANEIAVEAFLKKQISFTSIPELIEQVMDKVVYSVAGSVEDLLETDNEARSKAKELIRKYKI